MAVANSSKPFNPFYALLLVVGTSFAVTACAYGVMTVQMLHLGNPSLAGVDGAPAGTEPASSLLQFLDRYGFQLMMWQLGALAVATAAAIGLDEFFTARAAAASRKEAAK